MSRPILLKELENTRIASNYGGWVYCCSCDKTIGYLCYAGYDEVNFTYHCSCDNKGCMHIKMGDCSFENAENSHNNELIIIKNRYCCPSDESALITIREVNLKSFSCEISCHKCSEKYIISKL